MALFIDLVSQPHKDAYLILSKMLKKLIHVIGEHGCDQGGCQWAAQGMPCAAGNLESILFVDFDEAFLCQTIDNGLTMRAVRHIAINHALDRCGLDPMTGAQPGACFKAALHAIYGTNDCGCSGIRKDTKVCPDCLIITNANDLDWVRGNPLSATQQ